MNITIHAPQGPAKVVAAAEGESVLAALQRAGQVALAPCGGAGTCGRCGVLVRTAEGVGHRLACRTQVAEGMEVFLEDVGSMRVEGAEGVAGVEGAEGAEDSRVFAGRSSAERAAADASYGVAIDVGTTTMMLHLVDLDTRDIAATVGKVNPQVAFGADVLARINAAAEREGLSLLCDVLRESIDAACTTLCARAKVPERAIGKIALVGNTTMEHFAAGLDPRSLGVYPFEPRSLFGCDMPLHVVKEDVLMAEGVAEGARPVREAYFAPCVSAYVGGDITAGLHVAGMARRDELQLFIDIGTNGEMALGNRERMVCCATAAGPAFEGANITFGMPAMAGAISAVELSEEGMLSVRVIGGGEPVGLCGSGLLDAVACLVERGIVDETGRMNTAGEVPECFAALMGEEHGQPVFYLDAWHRVYLTQKDVREVQLAKAALRAGIETMLEELGANYADVAEVALAGGFGMHLNPVSSARIGLIPPELEGKVVLLGNAAGAGAVRLLFDEGRAGVEEIARTCEYLELSASETFNARYFDALNFDNVSS